MSLLGKVLDVAARWYQRKLHSSLRQYGLQYEDIIMFVSAFELESDGPPRVKRERRDEEELTPHPARTTRT